MLEIIKKYNNKKLSIGSLDCNLIWMEIFRNDVYVQMINNYKTFEEGSLLAYNLTKYYSISDYIENNNEYKQINKNHATSGCFFINDLHVSICLGKKTLTLVGNKFKQVNTELFLQDEKQKLYKKEL